MVDGNFPCGLYMSVLCIVLADVRAFIGVGRLTWEQVQWAQALQGRGAGPTDILGLEMVGSSGCKARG